MAATKKTTTPQEVKVDYEKLKVEMDRAVNTRVSRTSILVREYQKEKKIAVSLSPFYAPYLGNVARIAVNGISVFIPCTGKTYEIPETFAAELKSKVAKIDRSIQKQKAAASIQYERYMGELKL